MANTHQQVADNWSRKTGRCTRGFNMYYNDNIILSYGEHFPIARRIVAPSGKEVILFTSRSYSVSTAKHKSIVWRAIMGETIFHVDNVLAKTPEEHEHNVHIARAEIKALREKAKRARKYGTLLNEQADKAEKELTQYINHFFY